MANLTDIGYGVGKYLVASDASAIPDIGTNRKNLDLLNFKVAVNNAYALYNFKDGMIDAYQTEGGVDAGTSTNETYDSSGKYYSGSTTNVQNPTGGTVTTYTYGGSDYTLNTFTADGTFAAPSSGLVDILLVAGGGGGAGGAGVGGGGAGGFKYYSQTTAASGNSAVVVGDGGAAGAPWGGSGTNGDDTSFSSLTATGGGGGSAATNGTGGAGGSGGGGMRQNGPGGAGTPNQGSNGGQGGSNASMSFNAGGGGGGANSVGSNAGSHAGGSGGNGYTEGATVYDWESGSGTVTFPTNFYNGSSNEAYGGGGGGGGRNGGDGGGGTGGGGSGGGGGAGQDGKGGGGGGWGGTGDGPGGDGGNGIVIVRYVDGTFVASSYLNMTLVSNAQTAQTAPDEGRLMLYEEDATGTNTLDTDIKGYISRDGGTTYTQTPLTQDVVYNPKAGGFDSYNKLLLHCDGAAGSTTFTDSSDSGHTVTANGSFELTTTDNEWKFGGAGATADGTSGTWLSVPDSTDWAFGSGNFTLDMWIYPKTTNQILMGVREAAFSWELLYYNNAINFWTDAAQNDWPLGTGGVASNSIGDITNQWTHVAFVRNGNDWIFFINGVESGTGDGGNYSIRDVASTLSIGARSNGTYYQWNGYMDEIRISKGIARWTSNFTPPTNEYGLSQRLLSGAVDISGQPSGTSMKYKIETLNQSVTKVCRLHGASLLWA